MTIRRHRRFLVHDNNPDIHAFLGRNSTYHPNTAMPDTAYVKAGMGALG